MKVSLRMVLGLVGLANVAWGVPPRPAPPDLIPGSARTVGRNSKIWVFDPSQSVQVFGANGTEVAVTRTDITASTWPGVTKLTPVSELTPGQYEVRSDFEGVLEAFIVIDELDTTAPAAPMPTVTATGRVGQMPSTVIVTAPDADSFLVVLFEGQTWEASSVPAMSAKGSATVYGLRPGEAHLQVIRVDAAGNASEPADVVTTVPADRACSVAPVLPLSLLGLALLRRRRPR